MIISYAKRFVMFAPWKTASTTLHARLKPFNESPYDRFFHFCPFLNRVVHQHLTCAEFLAYPESREGFLIGSFVRNPYDRAYSGFVQLQSDAQTMMKMPFPSEWIRSHVKRQVAENFAQLFAADFDFDRWMLGVAEEQVFDVGRNTSFPLHPSHYWTHVAGRQYASFIGRVEDFEHDMDAFCARVGIEVPARVSENVRTSAAAESAQRYRYAERMSRAAIDRINALFGEDFERFGYDKV